MPINYVIFAAMASMMIIGAIIWAYLSILTFKKTISIDFEKSQLHQENLKSELDALKSDFVRFNNEGVDHVLKKQKILESEFHSVTAKVESIDTSVKNFYSKWARKLGDIAKKENEALTSEPTEEDQQTSILDFEGHTEQPARRQNGFHKLRSNRKFG